MQPVLRKVSSGCAPTANIFLVKDRGELGRIDFTLIWRDFGPTERHQIPLLLSLIASDSSALLLVEDARWRRYYDGYPSRRPASVRIQKNATRRRKRHDTLGQQETADAMQSGPANVPGDKRRAQARPLHRLVGQRRQR